MQDIAETVLASEAVQAGSGTSQQRLGSLGVREVVQQTGWRKGRPIRARPRAEHRNPSPGPRAWQ